MVRAASRAKKVLGDSAALVTEFISQRRNPDGGFCGRAEQSDLYYAVFALESLSALGADLPRDGICGYLRTFGGGEELDLVHLASLARCLACMGVDADIPFENIERYRSRDGAYSINSDADCGDVYGCFLATGAYEDCGGGLPEPQKVIDCVNSLKRSDGGYCNESTTGFGSTPATSAATTLLCYLGEPVDESAAKWLLDRVHPAGGFVAMPGLEEYGMADLLSTATSLHALSLMGISIDEIREPCLDFLDSLWSSRGAFCGSEADGTLDCEYTFYGLLALGHLAQ